MNSMGGRPDEEIRWLEHDADLLLQVRAGSVERLFILAAEALIGVMIEEGPPAGDSFREVVLEAEETEGLFVAWLNELIYLVADGRFLVSAIDSVRLEACRLSAVVRGAEGSDGYAGSIRDVKAATWHALEILETGGGWSARVLFDV